MTMRAKETGQLETVTASIVHTRYIVVNIR